ncbi:hypothetical protein [Luteolibacter sp. Populi]|uniref:hypothetical protein n=1 Tax=Luteolibacter sp. Populi TaxID=3230487 RepID=UPI003465D8E5
MKLHRSIPWLIASLTAIAALSLMLHTAVLRHSAAKVLRLAAEEAARSSPRHAGQEEEGAGHASRLPPGGPEREAAIGKRVRAALSKGHAFERTRALLALMKEFTPDDFRVALDLHRSLFPGDRGEDFSALLDEWRRRDPKAAMTQATQDTSVRMEVFDGWAKSDEKAAFEWAREEAPPDQQQAFMAHIIAVMARRDPALALDHLMMLDPGARLMALSPMLYLSGSDATEAALNWIDSVEDPAERKAALKVVFTSWTSDKAQEKLALLLRNPEALAEVDLGGAFANWASADPAAASAALDEIPAGPARRSATQAAILWSFSNDVEAALGIVDRYPGEVDDRLFQNCIVALSGRDPGRALEHAHLIKDPYTHDETYTGIIAGWINDEPAASREWLGKNKVPDGVRGYMEKRGYKEMLESISTAGK